MFFSPLGLPGIPPEHLRLQRFWYTVVTVGQMHHRLLKPYQQLPLQMAQLIDESYPVEYRTNLATEMIALKQCCVDPLFARPVLDCAMLEGGARSMVVGTLRNDLEAALRVKASNMEIELNFARSANCRTSMHGKKHGIPSVVAKHVTAEIKLAQHRKQQRGQQAVQNIWKPGRVYSKECPANISFIYSYIIYL